MSMPRLLTAADLARLPTQLASGDVCYELRDGVLQIMAPPGGSHGHSQARIGARLIVQGEDAGHGKAFAEVGIIVQRNPDAVLGADAAFIVRERLPERHSPEGYLETIPDLVVEIRSKNDTQPEIDDKVSRYLRSGVRVIWVPDPQRRILTVYRAGVEPLVLSESDVLTIDEVIPGFQTRVGDLLSA